jgi:hypothetical protein
MGALKDYDIEVNTAEGCRFSAAAAPRRHTLFTCIGPKPTFMAEVIVGMNCGLRGTLWIAG